MAIPPAPDTVEAAGPASPGALLRAGREQSGLSLEEMAQTLNLLPTQVAALEEDAFAALGGEVFARGHLRNYARSLGLPQEPVLAAYDARRPSSARSARWRGAVKRPPNLDHTLGKWHWGVAAALLVVAGLWWWQYEPGAEPPAAVATIAAISPVGNAAEPARPDSSVVERFAAAPPAEPAVAVMAAGQGASSALLAAVLPQGGNGAADGRDTGPEGDRLQLSFSADCWVEVRDASERQLFSDLRRAGEVLDLEGEAPFRVLLGYAPAVTMTFNGDRVAIVPGDDNRRARLTVGAPRASL